MLKTFSGRIHRTLKSLLLDSLLRGRQRRANRIRSRGFVSSSFDPALQSAVELLELRALLTLTVEPTTALGGLVFQQEVGSGIGGGGLDEPNAPGTDSTIEGINFIEDATNGGFFHIPPDPHGAVGLNHVVSVVNTSIEWHTKAGVQQNSQRLGRNGSTAVGSFFEPLAPVNGTFDPKVIYDSFANRFVVLTLERTDDNDGSTTGDAADTSRILVAVSDDSDPNGTWRYFSINSKMNMGGIDRWADYPGFAVDEEAVYITNNMFGFGGGAFGGVRLWILDKGVASGFYAGGAASVTVHDPYAGGGIATTTQPAYMYAAGPGSTGTFLVSYSGLTNDSSVDSTQAEFVQVVRVDNPLTSPTFSQQYINVGNIEHAFPGLPDAPQKDDGDSSNPPPIETNDRRALNAVWRNNQLWTTAEVLPVSGADANQVTAHWWNLNTTTLAAITTNDQGNVGGEDIAVGAYTFMPSIAVDAQGNMGIGFAVSAPSIFPSAAYTGRYANAAAGTTQPAVVYAAGQDEYVLAFSGTRNRWGDYSAITVDPSNDLTFWVFNQYAINEGSNFGTFLGHAQEGQWGTRWGQFTLAVDYGDAPNTHLTTFAADGARHISTGVRLGSTRDSEEDARTPLDGTGDDVTNTGAADDEDGVTIPSLTQGVQASFTIDVQNLSGGSRELAVWIDNNQNGVFGHTAERVLQQTVSANGNVNFNFTPSFSGTAFMRVRISTDTNMTPSGRASDGEVQDYLLTVAANAAPIINSLSPVDGATGVAVSSNLEVTFSENVQKGTGNILIKRLSDDSTFATIDVTSGQVTVSGAVVTINPTADLESLTDYYVQIATGAIEDTSGIDFAGIADTTTWNFETGSATAALSVSTQGHETGPVNIVYTVTLSATNNTGSAITFDLDDLGTGSALSGSDYTAIAGSAVISVASGSSTGTLAVVVTDDALLETTETVIASISGSSNAAVTVGTASATANITDNDTATASLSVTTHGNEAGPVDIVYTVTLSKTNNTGSAITFDLDNLGTGTATSGSDYTAIAGNATISVANGASTGTLTVLVTDDAPVEPTETVIAQISNPSNGAVTIGTASATANILDNDVDDVPLTLSIDDIIVTEGDSGTVNAIFTVTLSGTAVIVGSVTVDFATANGTAVQPGDYTSNSGTLTFASGETTKTITVAVNGDVLFEANETYFINLSNAINATISDNQGLGTITDNDTATASLSTTTQGNEAGPVNIVYTVTLSKTNNTGVAITVELDDLGTGTAASGSDYTAIAGNAQVSIAAGASTGTLTVLVTDDSLLEATETVIAQISGASNTAVSIGTASATANITDNDTATASLSTTTHGNEAGPVNIVYTVTLSKTNNTGVAITVELDDLGTGTAASGSDYTAIAANAQVSVAIGASMGTLTVLVTDDSLLEATETIIAQISGASNTAVTIGTASATANITDNDTATASLSTTTQGTEAGPVNIVYTVTLSKTNNTGVAITVELDDLGTGTAASGSDYTAIAGNAQVSIAAGASTGTLTVFVTDDALLEATEAVIAQISGASNTAVTIGTASATANITDNDTATASLSTTTHGNEAGPVNIVYTVTLSKTNNTGSAITFDLDDLGTGTATSGSDYTAIAGNATISVAIGASMGTLTVLVTDDANVEATETVIAQISGSSNTAVTIGTASATANITDNDIANLAPTAVTLAPSSASLAENSSTATATVLSTISVTDDGQGTNVLSLTGTDASSFEIVGNSLRLKAGVALDFETKPTYTVTVNVDDASVGGSPDASATFTLNLTNSSELGGIDVQKGQSQRSYVRSLDILFDVGGSDLLNLISGNRLQLTKFDLNGLNGVVTALPTRVASGSQIQLDFGVQGIGGNRNTNTGDGYYEIALDMDGNGSFESKKYFHRLLGDVNGSGTVDAADKVQVLSASGTSSSESDANGDGIVNIFDTSLVTRAVGRKLKDGLLRND